MANTREIIRAYFAGWVESDRDRVRSLVHDDLRFKSPDDQFERADDFLGTCWKYSEGFDAMDVLHEVYDETGGYLVYRSGDFTCGELVKVRDGKIAAIYVTYSPTC